jgi:hypothetical protein
MKAVPKTSDMIEVDENFDFDDFLEWYGLEILYVKDDCWYAVRECPGVGRRHEHSTETGFYYDGSHLGWSCFAQDCPTHKMTIGKLIKFLNEEHDPYPKRIWPDDPADLPDVILIENDEEDKILELFEGAEIIPEEPKLDPRAMEEEPDEETPAPQVPTERTAPLPAAPAAAEQKATEPTAEVSKPKAQNSTLEFPKEAMYGKLGELAKSMKIHPGLAYPALLACQSVLPVPDHMAGARVNLYVTLISRPGGGKNVAIDRALKTMRLEWQQDYIKFTAGGDTQLTLALGDRPKLNANGNRKGNERTPGPAKMLIVNNEMTEVMKKTTLESSALAPRLCDFFDDRQFEKRIGKEKVSVDCRLSWLGGIPASVEKPDRFRTLFGDEANYVLYSRFIFGYGGVKFNYKQSKSWTAPLPETNIETLDNEYDHVARTLHGCTFVKSLHPEAETMFEEWLDLQERMEKDDTRLDHLPLKIGVLTASANDEEEVSPACMAAALKFMDWQLEIKKVFKAGEAKNLEAEFDAMVVEKVDRKNRETNDFVLWRRLRTNCKWDNAYGASNVDKWMAALLESGSLVFKTVRKKQDGVNVIVPLKSHAMSREYAMESGRFSDKPEPEPEAESDDE